MKEIQLNVSNIDEISIISNAIRTILIDHKLNIYLDGDLGAGKTTLVSTILKDIGIKEPITSPTYPIIKQYTYNDITYNHIDVYRINGDVQSIGIDENIECEEVSFIEWSSLLEDYYQTIPHLHIYIKIQEFSRLFNIKGPENIIDLIKEQANELIY